jgi:hypothetical protein
MSLEGGSKKSPDRKSKLGAVETIAFATVLLGAIDHGPVQAMEMPQGTSWEQGVGQRIREAVMKEKHENAAIYVRLSNGESLWPAHFSGEEIHAGDEKASVGTVTSQAELDFLSKQRGATVEARCTIHTHPDAFTFSTTQGKSFSPRFKPPSSEDVGKSSEDTSYKTFYSMLHVGIKKDISAAADNSGLWYFKRSDKETIDSAKVDKWKETYGNFIGRSYFEKNFNFDLEYSKLRSAYREYLGADIRFVPYEQIANEPPCAGVEYTPGKFKGNQEIKIDQVAPATSTMPVGPNLRATPKNSRPGLGELSMPQTRGRLGDEDEPRIHEVGPPLR